MTATTSTRISGLLEHARGLLPSLSEYRELPRSWRSDLMAGATVGIVALPLALAFGVSSGLSAEQGLVTAIVAGVLAAIFGGSNVQVSGPTGAMVVVLAPIVADHGVGAVGVVTLMAGVFVLLGGVLRLGRTVSLIPWPVIEGFTLGIACTIFLQQVPMTASAHHAAPGELSSNAAVAAVQSLLAADPTYLLWALGAIAIVAASMIICSRVHPSLPGSLIGIVLATLAALALHAPLAPIGDIPSSLPAPALPQAELSALPALVPAALTVAALAAIESLLSARVAASISTTGSPMPDRELVGQGIASVGAALFGGMPATGAIARTSVNVRAGARTRVASIVHALVLLVVVLAASGPVGSIPLAALAGVLFVTAVRMVQIATVRAIVHSTRADATIFVITAIITVSFDLVVAVVIGMVLAGLVALRNLSRSTAVQLEPIASDVPQPGDEQIIAVRFGGPLIFVSAERVFETVMDVGPVTVVILRMSKLEQVDATGAQILTEIVRGLERRGITVLIKGVRSSHLELFDQVGVLGALRDRRHLVDSFDEALAHARSHVERARAATP